MRRPLVMVVALVTVAIVGATSPPGAGAQIRRADSDARLDRIRRLIVEIQRSEVPPESDAADRPPAETAPDLAAPGVALPAVMAELDAMGTEPVPPTAAGALGRARRNVENALELYSGGSPRPDLGYLAHTGRAIEDAAAALTQAGARSDASVHRRLAPLVDRLATVARRILTDVLETAVGAGVNRDVVAQAQAALAEGDRRAASGDGAGATGAYAQGLAIVAKPGTLVFDLERFEKNLRDALLAESVGYAYTITRPGRPDRSNSGGFARTAVDLPVVNQAPTKRMHVASVSKTITAVAVLRLLEARGLTPNDSVAPWLPSDWTQGNGVAALTFRQLMIHRSGLAVSEPGPPRPSDYASLRQNVIAGVIRPCAPQPCDPAYNYENANFGLFRVIVPQLLGIDPTEAFPDVDPAISTAAIFVDYIRSDILGPAGVSDAGCTPTDSLQTLLYRFPDDGSQGAKTGDFTVECGGFGFYLSTNELGRFLHALRFTNTLLSPASRKAMNTGFLGWQNPADGIAAADGKFGVYFNHGGFWFFDEPPPDRGSHSCVMNFPIAVQAALHINSHVDGQPTACDVLQQQFDAAWVAA